MDTYSLKEKSSLSYDSINLIKLYSVSKPELVNSMKSASEIEFADFAIKYSDGILQGLTNQIFFKLKRSVNYFEIEQILKSFAISKIEPTIFNDSIFIITLPSGSTINSLEFSNLLFEKGIVEFAEPNFIRYLFPTTSDPYYPQQWAIHNNGQFGGTSGADTKVQEAWTFTKGSSCIKIAVLDVGVDLTHPDLQVNLLTGYDETGLWSNGGARGNEAHGTCVTGIISAIENYSGVVGIAPLCKIIPIRIAIEDAFGNWITTDNQIASGFYHAWHDANADIINNSWGGGSPSTTVTNSINNAIINGRNNKGCIVVFASGNFNSSVSYPGTLENVISVGASSMCDTRKRSSSNPNLLNPGVSPDSQGVSCDNENWWGSNYGNELDIVAPGVHIYSTDIQGVNGYNSNGNINTNYYDLFNGTSSATPHVSAILALILSVNPALTQSQARQVLESNTDKIGNYTYSASTGHPNGTWNAEVGYGRVNAFKALSALIGGPIVGNSLVCNSTNSSFTYTNVPANSSVFWSKSSNIEEVSGQNTNTYTVKASVNSSGDGWIMASLNSACTGLTYPIWVGTPQITNLKVDGGTYYPGMQVCPGNHWLSVTPIGGNAGTATWTVPYGIPYFAGTNTLNFTFPSASNGVSISAKSTNSCGTGTNANFYLIRKSYGCTGSYAMTIYPNPASDNITITLNEEALIPPADSVQSISGRTLSTNYVKTSDEATYTVNIYNSQSSLVSSVTKAGKSFSVPLINMQDGTYIVEVTDGKSIFRQQLIVKRD
jgi:subtilisin family serine protease